MSNFRLNLPGYLAPTFSQLSQDHHLDRQDLAALRQAAAAQSGSIMQEALETQTLNTLEAQLQAHGGDLHVDAVQVEAQSMNIGQAVFEVRLLGDKAAEPSLAEQTWAGEFEQRVKQKTPYTTADMDRYKDICERFLASREGMPAPTAAELDWANGIQRQAIAGQQPSTADMLKFRDIVARQALHVRAELAKLPAPKAAPSLEDMRWAMTLQEKVNTEHYSPSDSEQLRFVQINQALQKFGPPAGFVPPDQLQTKK